MNKTLLRKIAIGILAVGALVLLIWVSIVACAAGDLVAQLRGAQTLVSGGVGDLDPARVTVVLDHTRRDVVMLKRQVGWLAAPVAHLRWVPGIGSLLGETPTLLELGDSLTELGVLLWADASPALVRYQQGEPWQRLLPDLLSAFAISLEHKQSLADRALDAYTRLDVAALPSQMRPYAELLGEGLPFLIDGLEIAEVAPALLGFSEPQTYLVLALNEDELRPGGGFITGVGEVQVVDADVVSMVFRDSYAVDDFSLPYPDPPEPLRQFLGADLWVFRDSNWSPDYPTAVRQALELYRLGDPVEVAGVIAVDQRAVQLVLEGLGPLDVSGVSAAVTADSVVDYMHETWAPEDGTMDVQWWQQRKSFMGDLAATAMTRLRSGDVDVSAFGNAVVAALDQRHIQVYLANDVAQSAMVERGWDGGLTASSTDYVALVEANLGYNKASGNVARTISYAVDLSESTPRAEIAVRFTHLSDRENSCLPEIRYDAVYADMMHRCYWAYLRLYVPQGAALISATSSPIPANLVYSHVAWPGTALISNDLDHTVFSQALLLPTGSEKELRFSYVLPADVVSYGADGTRTYRLLLHKQAGTEQLTGVVSLLLPENAVVLSASPDRFQMRNGVLVTDFNVTTDLEFTVHYQVVAGGGDGQGQ